MLYVAGMTSTTYATWSRTGERVTVEAHGPLVYIVRPDGDEFAVHPSEIANDETATYWASIGGNIRGEAMSPGDWADFRLDLAYTLADVGADVLSTVDGSSSWENVSERSHLVLFSIPAANDPDLRSKLARLAHLYEQDAVGLVGGPGTDTLVYPSPEAPPRPCPYCSEDH
jgi:hypothetical protein